MLAIYIIPLYLIISIYIFKKIISWLELFIVIRKNKILLFILSLVYTFLILSFYIAFIYPNRFLKLLGNYWLGIIQFILVITLISIIIKFILKKLNIKIISKKILTIYGLLCISFVLCLTIYGSIHSKKIDNTNYNINISKETQFQSITITLVSDIHLGYNTTSKHINNMINLINKNNPDLVVIAGDIFDNEYSSIKNPDKIISLFRKIKSKYGVYAVYGNHDIEEKILAGFTFNKDESKKTSSIEMDEFLEEANIKLLRDESILIANSFYIIGRLDAQKLGVIDLTKRKSPKELVDGLDKTKPIFVIDHQPSESLELSNNNVDLILSGHTHDGQMFPASILNSVIWDNPHGLKKYGNTYSIVTSGIGTYGPNMRIGSTAEVVNVKINFN